MWFAKNTQMTKRKNITTRKDDVNKDFQERVKGNAWKVRDRKENGRRIDDGKLLKFVARDGCGKRAVMGIRWRFVEHWSG